MAITQKQSRFGFEYCKDYNGTKAAIRAGYAEGSAQETASRLLSNEMVQKRIATREAELAARAEIDEAWVINQWVMIASADPRELTEMIVRACPRCWPLADLKLDQPNPFCEAPRVDADGINTGGCGGAGDVIVRLKDTRTLSPAALRLFAGVKQTKNGIEIKFRDQDAALANIAGCLGMKLERREVSGPGGGPIQTAARTYREMTDEELLAIIHADELVKGTIEGTFVEVDANSKPLNELGDGSSP